MSDPTAIIIPSNEIIIRFFQETGKAEAIRRISGVWGTQWEEIREHGDGIKIHPDAVRLLLSRVTHIDKKSEEQMRNMLIEIQSFLSVSLSQQG